MQDTLKLKAAIQKALSNIGKTNGTSPLPSRRNISPALHEFFVAETLRSAVNKRYDEAKKTIIEQAGIDLPNLEESTQTIAAGNEHFDLLVKKNAGSTTIDKTMLKNSLSKRYGDIIANAIIEEASKPKAGAVTITPVIK
jgi:hypothetical protein